jgi:hypothetical protein
MLFADLRMQEVNSQHSSAETLSWGSAIGAGGMLLLTPVSTTGFTAASEAETIFV